MSEVSLSIVIPSCGRPTLIRAMESCSSQMNDCDEMFVRLNADDSYGHATRNRMMPVCKGSHLGWTDDDDTLCDGALATVRECITEAPDRVHVFRMLYRGGIIWRDPQVRMGNVSTQMFWVPNIPELLGVWSEEEYEGDYRFLVSTLELHGTEPVWHKEVIARYGN